MLSTQLDGNNSRTKSNLLSLAIHCGVVALLLSAASNPGVQRKVGDVVNLVGPLIAPYLPDVKPAPRTGGGGGDRSPVPASKGRLPKLSPRQFTPPMVVVHNPEPKLLMEATLIATTEITLPSVNLAQFGDPNGVAGPPSNGTGSGGGIGSGRGGGVGRGSGPGYGDGDWGMAGGNSRTYRVTGTTPAALLWSIEPEYSDEARKARLQGTVELMIEVDPNGKARNIRVEKGLGLGLDDKAIAAVYRWKFRPAYREGRPVASNALIEVNFRLL